MALADDVKRRKAVFLDFRSSRQIEPEAEQLQKPFLFQPCYLALHSFFWADHSLFFLLYFQSPDPVIHG